MRKMESKTANCDPEMMDVFCETEVTEIVSKTEAKVGCDLEPKVLDCGNKPENGFCVLRPKDVNCDGKPKVGM